MKTSTQKNLYIRYFLCFSTLLLLPLACLQVLNTNAYSYSNLICCNKSWRIKLVSNRYMCFVSHFLSLSSYFVLIYRLINSPWPRFCVVIHRELWLLSNSPSGFLLSNLHNSYIFKTLWEMGFSKDADMASIYKWKCQFLYGKCCYSLEQAAQEGGGGVIITGNVQ